MRIKGVPGGLALVAATLGASAVLATPAVSASTEPCPDVEVVYARGTAEPAGVGQVGDAFVAALRNRVPAKSVAVYPVNYPANNLFGDRVEFTYSVIDGIRDASVRVQATAVNCPDTRIVLNHAGGPLGIGPYEGCRSETFARWHASMQALAHHTADHEEAVNALLEKRPPTFQGRY